MNFTWKKCFGGILILDSLRKKYKFPMRVFFRIFTYFYVNNYYYESGLTLKFFAHEFVKSLRDSDI